VCPHCRQNAPIVYRGIAAYCTACGQPRLPLVAKSVNLAGQPSQVGGTLTRVLGFIVLFAGLAVALVVFGILAIFVPALWIAAAVGAPLAVLAGLAAWGIIRSGRSLEKSGLTEQRRTQMEAVFALARNEKAPLSAQKVSAALGIPYAHADELLTDLAKRHPELASVEIDDQGGVFYRIDAGTPRLRVAPSPSPKTRVEPWTEAAELLVDELAEEAERRSARRH
jgi:hypothetical protein